MSQPSAPPPYEDRNPLYPGPPPPGGYGQPTVLPGGYPAYPQPGYGHPAGYPQPMPPIHPPMSYGPGHGYGGEERAVSDNFGSGEWSDRKVRHAFIRKVYAIISVQLLITVAIIAIFTFVKPVSNFVRANLAVYYASYAVFLATYLTLICCQGPRRRFPWNIILLTLFTLAMGFMTGTISRMSRSLPGGSPGTPWRRRQGPSDSAAGRGLSDTLFRAGGLHLLHRSLLCPGNCDDGDWDCHCHCAVLQIYLLAAHGLCCPGCHLLHFVPGLRHAAGPGEPEAHHQPRGLHHRRPADLHRHRLHLHLCAAAPGEPELRSASCCALCPGPSLPQRAGPGAGAGPQTSFLPLK
uniref:Transmembrane BAX inhibitor motif containing 1 n=1 Tax=Sus scrofa TaxID=9823 RepID=A0A8D0JUD0_PIG